MGSTSVGDSACPRDVDGGTLEDPDGGGILVDLGGGLKLIKKWSSLFGVQSTGKSCFPPIKDTSTRDKVKFSIEILDQIIDKNISRMDSTLVG